MCHKKPRPKDGVSKVVFFLQFVLFYAVPTVIFDYSPQPFFPVHRSSFGSIQGRALEAGTIATGP